MPRPPKLRGFYTTLLAGSIALALLPAPSTKAQSGDETGLAVFPAVLLPGQTALIKARHDEQVAEVPVRIGSRVRKDELLVRFVDAEERLKVKLAEAYLANVRADLVRMQELFDDGQVSQERLENNVTKVQMAEAELELTRVALDELSFRAPFGGVVSERFVDPGTSVENGSPLVRVSAVSTLKIEALLPEDMLPRLGVSQEIQVELDNPATSFSVTYDPRPLVVDPASGTFLLQIRMNNRSRRLTPGVRCRVAIGGGGQPEAR
jgi:membrane fusion protein (multidrug efflux system)